MLKIRIGLIPFLIMILFVFVKESPIKFIATFGIRVTYLIWIAKQIIIPSYFIQFITKNFAYESFLFPFYFVKKINRSYGYA